MTIQLHSDTLILFLSLLGNTNECCPLLRRDVSNNRVGIFLCNNIRKRLLAFLLQVLHNSAVQSIYFIHQKRS